MPDGAETLDQFNERQNKQREDLRAKLAAEKAMAKMWMDKVRPLPAKLNEWAYRNMFIGQRHMRIKINGSVRIGVCLHCGWSGPTKNKVGIEVKCPSCRTLVQTVSEKTIMKARDSRFGSRIWPQFGHVAVIQRIEGALLVRRVRLSYAPTGRIHEVLVEEALRTVWPDKAKRPIQFVQWSWNSEYGQPWTYSPQFRPDVESVIYPPSLKVLKESRWKWSGMVEWHQKKYKVPVERWMKAYMRCPCLEMLAKSGKEAFVYDVLCEYNKTNGVYHAKTYPEIRKWFKVIRDAKLDVNGIETLGKLVAMKADPTVEEMREINGTHMRWTLPQVLRDHKGLEYHETLDYLRKCKKIRSNGRSGSDYADYLRMAVDLGWDMTDADILRPKDLTRAHDHAVELTNRKRDAEYAAKKAKADAEQAERNAKCEEAIRKVKEKNKILEASMSGFVAILPKSVEDLTREGQEMHHCVGMYADRVARGECVIVFVRAEKEPEKSLVTVELRDGKVAQARAKFNKEPSPEVEQFLKAWTESWSKPDKAVKSPSKKAARRIG